MKDCKTCINSDYDEEDHYEIDLECSVKMDNKEIYDIPYFETELWAEDCEHYESKEPPCKK